MPEIYSLVPDIYDLLTHKQGPKKINPENLQKYLDTVKELLIEKLEKPREKKEHSLRLSKIGTRPRKLWMETHSPEYDSEGTHSGPAVLKFLVGSVLEPLILFLAKEAGHKVEREQEDVLLDGVPGHPDGLIDGCVVDVKTSTPYTFDKFSKGEILFDSEADEYGYIPQLGAYREAMGLGEEVPCLFLAFQKSSCELALLEVPNNYIPSAKQLIKEAREVIASPTCPEELCFQPKPDGKSGNIKIASPCSYCNFKWKCFPNLRAFSYSNGVRYLSTVVKTPDVEEVTEFYKRKA